MFSHSLLNEAAKHMGNTTFDNQVGTIGTIGRETITIGTVSLLSD